MNEREPATPRQNSNWDSMAIYQASQATGLEPDAVTTRDGTLVVVLRSRRYTLRLDGTIEYEGASIGRVDLGSPSWTQEAVSMVTAHHVTLPPLPPPVLKVKAKPQPQTTRRACRPRYEGDPNCDNNEHFMIYGVDWYDVI